MKTPEGESGRGPKLDVADHKALVLWACDCTEHVLPYFDEDRPEDGRPRKAIEAARAWTRGEIPFPEVRVAAFAAHAAARDVGQPAARAAARSAGHAAATAHVPDHARHAASYAVTAVRSAAGPNHVAAAATEERARQVQCLPERLRSIAFPARGNGWRLPGKEVPGT